MLNWEEKICKQIEIPSLLWIFLLIPHNKLPCFPWRTLSSRILQFGYCENSSFCSDGLTLRYLTNCNDRWQVIYKAVNFSSNHVSAVLDSAILTDFLKISRHITIIMRAIFLVKSLPLRYLTNCNDRWQAGIYKVVELCINYRGSSGRQ